MNEIRFHCPACHHLLVVPPEAASLSGPCPNCGTLIRGPGLAPLPQPQPLNPPPSGPSDFTTPVRLEAPPEARPPVAFETPPEEPAPTPCPVEKAPQAEAPPEPLQPKVTAQKASKTAPSLSLLQGFLLCFLSSLVFFVLGFFLGKKGAVNWDDLLKEFKKQEEPAETPIDSLPLEEKTLPETNALSAEESLGSQPPLELIEQENHSTAEASLRAFIASETWTSRSAFVLFADQILPHMEACAQVHGDGPFVVDSLQLTLDFPTQKVFELSTPQHPQPFNVILMQEGPHWKVDWDGFVDFYYHRLRDFAAGREGPMEGVFRVLLKPAPGETAPLSPARCIVSSVMNEDDSYQVTSATDSPARKALAEIFQAYLQGDRPSFEAAMADRGIPLIVTLSRNGAENPTLLLKNIVAPTWNPLDPKKTPEANSSGFY